jgi:putative flippase GtrA
MTLLTNAQERTRFFKFLIVGIVGAVVDFGVMNLLTKLFDAPLVLAGSVSFICAVISNFTWNRIWTYPDSRSRPLLRQLLMFTAVNVAGIAIRIPILYFIEPPLFRLFERIADLKPAAAELIAKNLTLATAMGIVMLWNFFVNRYWTYNDVDHFKQENAHE